MYFIGVFVGVSGETLQPFCEDFEFEKGEFLFELNFIIYLIL